MSTGDANAAVHDVIREPFLQAGALHVVTLVLKEPCLVDEVAHRPHAYVAPRAQVPFELKAPLPGERAAAAHGQ